MRNIKYRLNGTVCDGLRFGLLGNFLDKGGVIHMGLKKERPYGFSSHCNSHCYDGIRLCNV